MDSKQSGSEHGDELRDAYAGFEDVGLADDPLQAGPSRRDMDPSSTPSESSTSGFTPQRSSLSTGYSSLDAPLDEQPWASQGDHNVGAPAYPPPRPSTFRPPVSIASSVSATPTHSFQPRLSGDVILGVAVVDFNHLVRHVDTDKIPCEADGVMSDWSDSGILVSCLTLTGIRERPGSV